MLVILFYFASLSRIADISIMREQIIQQIVEGAASNNRVCLQELRHAQYRLKARE